MSWYILLAGFWSSSAQARDYDTVLWDETHGVLNRYELNDYFAEYADELGTLGFSVAQTTGGILSEDLDSLGVLIIPVTAAYDTAYTSAEAAAIEDFVSEGGGLLLVTDNPYLSWTSNFDEVTDAFGLSAGVSTINDNADSFASHATTDGISSITVLYGGSVSGPGGFTEVAWSGSDAVVLVSDYGAGRVVLVGDIAPFIDTASADDVLFRENVATWLSFELGTEDLDGDGYGIADDCDETDTAINPGATEVCDLVDNDCDELLDDLDADVDTATMTTWYADADGDGFGDSGVSVLACLAPTGHVADASDCDDADTAVHPDASEVCDGVDNDCDVLVDDDDSSVDPTTMSTWYIDRDGDGYGSPDDPTAACAQPVGATDIEWAVDCDDEDAAIHPDAIEVCDAQDNDCDALVDDDDDSLDESTATTWYGDQDGDGYGGVISLGIRCVKPDRAADQTGDCDDTDADVFPGAPETEDDGIDQDCDGLDSTSDDAGSGEGETEGETTSEEAEEADDAGGSKDSGGCSSVGAQGSLEGTLSWLGALLVLGWGRRRGASS